MIFFSVFSISDTMWIFGTKEPLENILANNNILNISQLYTIINLPKRDNQAIYNNRSFTFI